VLKLFEGVAVKSAKVQARIARHARVRKKVRGTKKRPRLAVYRSLKHIYAQIIDDDQGVTLASASSLSPDFRARLKQGNNVAAAKLVGELIAQKALELGIQQVVFDRGGFAYHGRVRAVAEGAREKGLQF